MSEMLVRTVRLDGSAVDGRRVFGVVVPYGTATEVSDPGRPGSYREVMAPGVFARSIAERGHKVKLLRDHDRTSVLGRASRLEERPEGLFAEFVVSDTVAGNEALALARDGALDGFSVGFRPLRHRVDDDGTVVRLEAALLEVSLTAFPAYADAAVAGVRSQTRPFLSRRDALQRLADLER